MVFTCDELDAALKASVSEKRYIHSLGVAQTTQNVLVHYGCKEAHETWGCFEAARFCGLAHDLAREYDDSLILEYCEKNNLKLSDEEINSPVLAHGVVSSDIARKLCGDYPDSWRKAICVHTTGTSGMDDLALALFIADYLEPSRTFLDDNRRNAYLSEPTIGHCAYRILCDMIDHWRKKGFHSASEASLSMKEDLERKLGL